MSPLLAGFQLVVLEDQKPVYPRFDDIGTSAPDLIHPGTVDFVVPDDVDLHFSFAAVPEVCVTAVEFQLFDYEGSGRHSTRGKWEMGNGSE